MVNIQRPGLATYLLSLILLGLMLIQPAQAGLVCAEVKIEIEQELTFERQAFDASMKINNDLDSVSIEDIAISVYFQDKDGQSVLASSDPNSTEAKFFIRIDSMEGIDSINGGSIAPKSQAEIHWLIIPAPGASSDSSGGELYYVGAELSYSVGGNPEEVVVAPDFIRVKPLPEITLDYFLTQYVNADDPLTSSIETPEPFTLGVRVQNNGAGVAKNLKIDSAQPTIVENEQGLLIDFRIIGSSVNDQPREPTLLINFGDILPAQSSIGRWVMETTLSGEFTGFNAVFTHADELGGSLTSVLAATNAHLLVHDVLVDLPGRDAVRDFLADNNGEYTVYESNNVDTLVEDQSAVATLNYVSQNVADSVYSLSATATNGFSYIKLEDPFSGGMVIKEVIRSDGKVLPLDNVWFSKERTGTGDFDPWFNLFDVQSTGEYSVIFTPKTEVPLAPNLQFIPDRTTHEGKTISFLVEASDPNGTIPVITALNLPDGAGLTDQGNGKSVFAWTPAIGQAGSHEITYQASDGVLTSARKAFIHVNPAHDTDGDGMDDAWEMAHFGTLDRDGSGDYDGDGASDLEEFLQDTDPDTPNVFNFALLQTGLGSAWVDISLDAFVNPIVLAGVPSDNDAESAVVRLRNLQAEGFKARIQEWDYQDDIHALEAVSFMAIEAGRHRMADGSIWEAGSFDIVGERRWLNKRFAQPFMGVPQVYLSIQTTNDDDPVIVRARNVSETGFSAALFEEENNASHGREVVAYVAIYAPESAGSVNIVGSNYLVNSSLVSINNDDLLLSDGVTSLRLEEEQSQDDEVLHAYEDIAVLMLNDAVFAQDNSALEDDTVLIRRHSDLAIVSAPIISPAGGVISQAIMVSLATATPDALIYFTLDGSTPDPVDNAVATQLYDVPFEVSATTTVKAIGRRDSYADSLEASASYTFVANTAPQFIAIPDRTVVEGQSLSFVVQALDQNTSLQAALTVDLAGLSGSPTFVDNGDGTGRFSWIPPIGTASEVGYSLNFIATDAQDSSLTDLESMRIVVTSAAMLDSDHDGMPDEWELQYSLDPNDPSDAQEDADDDGADNLTEYEQGRNPLVAENNPPVAAITSDVTSGEAPLTVVFSGGTSSDSDGTIVGYVWSSSDGGSGSEPTFTNTFEHAGDYTVSLTVTDNLGATHSETVLIVVTEPATNTPPIARISADVSSGPAPLTVSFDGATSSDADGAIVAYEWSSSDGGSSSDVSFTHTFSDIGSYTVSLTVTDDQGVTHAATMVVKVIDPNATNNSFIIAPILLLLLE